MNASEDRDLGFADIVGALARPGIYLNLLPYLVLIPLVVGLNLLALRVDERLGLGRLLDEPARAVLFVLFTCAGLAVLWWTYAWLGILGDGSPSPHLGGTRRLVTAGPYSAVRHPSVLGKLLGVLGTGFLFGSPTFLGLVLPLLLAWSTTYNRFYQEGLCVRQFGQDYLDYRRRVPFLVPSPGRLLPVLRAPGTTQWFSAWLLATVLALQILQLWWLSARQDPRYVWVPLSFDSAGPGSFPEAPLVSGPAVLGPTLTMEDVVRGLLVMDEQPDLALDARQRRAIARELGAASREREAMLACARERREAEQLQAEVAARMLEVLTPAQRRLLQQRGALPAAGLPTSPWEPLLRALSGPEGAR